MQIQRVQTGSESSKAAGPVQRHARGQQVKQSDATPIDTDADADTAGALDALAGSKSPSAPRSETAPDSTQPTSTHKLHPRLAAYAQRIENRLAHVAADRDLTPRQQAAIQQAQTQFHGLIQRLDDAHSSGAPGDQKRPLIDSLTAMIEHLVQSVNHIQSGGPLDISG
jgi:hypothetical protein